MGKPSYAENAAAVMTKVAASATLNLNSPIIPAASAKQEAMKISPNAQIRSPRTCPYPEEEKQFQYSKPQTNAVSPARCEAAERNNVMQLPLSNNSDPKKSRNHQHCYETETQGLGKPLHKHQTLPERTFTFFFTLDVTCKACQESNHQNHNTENVDTH